MTKPGKIDGFPKACCTRYRWPILVVIAILIVAIIVTTTLVILLERRTSNATVPRATTLLTNVTQNVSDERTSSGARLIVVFILDLHRRFAHDRDDSPGEGLYRRRNARGLPSRLQCESDHGCSDDGQ